MLQRWVPSTLARADRVIAVSEATARDLVELAGISKDKIRVVPNGLTPGMVPVHDKALIKQTLNSIGISGRYILYVGVLDPNKDLHNLIAGYAGTARSFRRTHTLVIAGPRNWFRPVLEEEAHRLGVGGEVRFVGYVPEGMLSALYSGAAVMVAPSPLEGFGFPVVESMACGTPIIVADGGALPEVAGDAAIRVPPGNPGAFAQALERIAGDDRLAGDLVARGLARCRSFSWEETARKTLDVYEEMVE